MSGASAIYDSRNYWGLTDFWNLSGQRWSTIVEITEVLQTPIFLIRSFLSTIVEITEVLQTFHRSAPLRIYDSRNYWGLTDGHAKHKHKLSTIVEITEVLQTPIFSNAFKIYDSRNYWGLTDLEVRRWASWSTIVEITEVLQTKNFWWSRTNLR